LPPLQPVELTLSANPATLIAPGGAVSISVMIKNNQSTNLILQNLVDEHSGPLDGVGSCELPQTIAPNSTYNCAYNVMISEQTAGTVVTRVVTATGSGQQYHNDLDIAITAKPIRRILLPVVSSGYVAGEPNNGICSAQPIVTNSPTFFLPDDQNDWYRFTLAETGRVRITLSNYVPRDGQIIAYAGNCTAPVFLRNNGSFDITKIIELGVQPAGEYFIWVLTDSNFNSTQPYQLHVAVTAP
jgi:hypothetical protein